LTIDDKGEEWLRVITWFQVWARAQEMNPGSTIQGEDADWAGDLGLRRARVLLLGQINPRIHIVTHFGINNQTFNNIRKPQLYIHDGWVQFEVIPKAFAVGAGLHYWNGVSRMTNASTLNFLAMDAPILNWHTSERTDQFARQMGLFGKGKLGGFDYRVAVNKPFAVTTELAPGGMADYSASNNTFSYTGYGQWQFGDKEGNLLPYTVGTYLGKRKIFNVGAGAYYHPEAMGQLSANGANTETFDQLATGVDVFVDRPVGDGAITAYGVWYHYDFGPNNIRNIGIMNTGGCPTDADGNSQCGSFNGAGNAYPTMGTGEHFYLQAGYLLPFQPGKLGIQPYATAQYSIMEAIDDPATIYELGSNWYIKGQSAKISTHYRNRPVVEASGDQIVSSPRANEVIPQFAVTF